LSTELRLRLPAGEWARRHASGELDDLMWVDVQVMADGPAYEHDDADPPRFRGEALESWLPRPLVEAIEDAQAQGTVTLFEAMALLLARPAWLVQTRADWWRSTSPIPQLLAHLVEAYGVGAEIHRRESEALMRLVALLPPWHPHRGTLQRAEQLWTHAHGTPPADTWTGRHEQGAFPRDPPVQREVFTCRSLSWWQVRHTDGAQPLWRIEGGFVRFQPQGGGWEVRRGDVALAWHPPRAPDPTLLRLLPPWTTLRVVALDAEGPDGHLEDSAP